MCLLRVYCVHMCQEQSIILLDYLWCCPIASHAAFHILPYFSGARLRLFSNAAGHLRPLDGSVQLRWAWKAYYSMKMDSCFVVKSHGICVCCVCVCSAHLKCCAESVRVWQRQIPITAYLLNRKNNRPEEQSSDGPYMAAGRSVGLTILLHMCWAGALCEFWRKYPATG